jgi:hypothetical protein
VKSIRALACAATIALLAPAAGAGVIEGYAPYGHLVEGNLTSSVFAAGDGFLLKGDDTQTFDGALRWSLSFATARDALAMTGDATFAVPAESVPDGMSEPSLALYRSTLDDVSHGRLGDRVLTFDVEVPTGASWAHAALDGALAPLGPGLLYTFVFEGESVGNPYLQARVDFLARPLAESNPPPAVPEPASVALMLAGAALLAGVARRTRREPLTPAP